MSTKRKTLAAGLHYGLPMADYIADPCLEPSLSASGVRALVEKSPLAAWKRHPRLGGEVKHSRASDVGSAAHAMVLEGAEIIQVVAKVEKADGTEITPRNWQTNAAKAARAEIREAGLIPMLPHETPPVYAMAKKAGEALAEVGEGKPEVTIIWQEKNGIWCRARTDWLIEDRTRPVVDYKTTKKSARPGEWIRRTLYTDGYDISAAWYLRGLEKLGEARPEYRFLIQEQDAPHDYGWVALEMHSEPLDDIRPWIAKAIRLWGECLESGEWPGYPKHVHYADPVAWRANQVEESELAEEMADDVFGGEE